MILDPHLYVEVLIYSKIYMKVFNLVISQRYFATISCVVEGEKGVRKKGEWVRRGQESGWVGGRNSRWKAWARQVDRLVGVVGRAVVV